MATCSTATLIEQACANNFLTAANDVLLYRAIKHQLLCNIFAGGGGGGGVTQFTQLTDVPNSYVGQAGLGVRVNAGATGLEFYTITSGVTKRVSGNIALDGATTKYQYAHTLGSAPAMVRAVLVCLADDGGTTDIAGTETAVEGWFQTAILMPAFEVRADATNVYVNLAGNPLVGNEAQFQVNGLTGGFTASPTTFNNYALKIYAWL